MVPILDLVEKNEILDLVEKKKPTPILNLVEKMVPILDLVECQLIEAVTASSTFPKLPLTNLHATDCHTRLWWKYLFAPNSNTKSQH